ncbi:MAG TPA: hypothetical protein P5550_06680 [Bacteroidales bacterium]|nr:hypothetical protein [Bacteroidales bacterium]
MKTRLISLIFLMIMVSGSSSLYSQSCETWFPFKQGTVIEMTHYDGKDKVTGTSRQSVLSINQSGNGFEARIKIESTGEKKDEHFESEYTVKCSDGVLKVEMNQYISPEMMGSLEGMEFEVTGDELELPQRLSVGQTLDDGEIIMKVMNQGMAMMTMSVKVFNRQISARENVTTPAGSFDCYKLTYDVESKVMLKVSSKGEEWIAEGTGVVKTATYSKSGKLTSYSLLTGITRP